MPPIFPFTAIVGQERMRRALILNAVDTRIGGVLIRGERGTAKSTASRALAALLPKVKVVDDCRFGCDPDKPNTWCTECKERFANNKPVPSHIRTTSFVNLPVSATEDRVVGALDLEKALTQGVKSFQPGLLAQAHRGFLYIDEVNLLDDHLVDLLIDVAASGENLVEREGLSVRHPARFVLVGSGNPEEGELRPQMLDRFGLSVQVKTPQDLQQRVEVVKRREAFERDPQGFRDRWQPENERLQARILRARKAAPKLVTDDAVMLQCADLCQRLGTDGLRAELTLLRASRALAALTGAKQVQTAHVRQVATLALRHRLRRNPLDDTDSGVRVQRSVQEVMG